MSLLRNLGNRIIEARQRQARAQVNAILRSWDPEMRKQAGKTEQGLLERIFGTVSGSGR